MTEPKPMELTQPSVEALSEDTATPKKKHIGVSAFAGTFGTSLFIQACAVLQGILVARLVGPVGRGEFAAVILWPMMFATFGLAGIPIAIAKISAKIDDYGSIARAAIVLTFITSAISSLACFISLPWLIPQAESHLISLARLFILVIPLTRLVINSIAIDQGCGNFKHFNVTRAIMNPVYVAMLFCLWLFDLREVRWCVIALLAARLSAVVGWLFLAVRGYAFIGKLYSVISIIKQSIRFSLAGIFQQVYMHVDKILMLWLLGTKNLGLYMVALSASAVMSSITISAGMVSFTMAAQTSKGGGFDRLARTFRISVLLWMFFGGILAAIMSFVLPLVYGGDFAAAINPARMLIIGSAFAGLANMLEQAVRGQGRAFIGLEGRAGGLVVMVISGIVFAKTFGLPGVCFAYIAGQFVCLIVIIWRTNKHYSVKGAGIYIPRFSDVNYLFKLCFERSLRYIKKRKSYEQ